MEGTDQDHRARSDFVRRIVHRSENYVTPSSLAIAPTRTVVQFWNDLCNLPNDVRACIESWRGLERRGFDVQLFDDQRARDFISHQLGWRYEQAYDKCYHPAMQSDYFRLCYIFVEGGCYVDADDEYNGVSLEDFFGDGRLKVQPLCYDASANQMVPAQVFTKAGANSSSWIFYLNNNPLIAHRGHPIVHRALKRATEILGRTGACDLPEIQSTTGPGNLTKSFFDLAIENREIEATLFVLRNWDAVASTKWPLSYRSDARNWRLSNQRRYSAGRLERYDGGTE